MRLNSLKTNSDIQEVDGYGEGEAFGVDPKADIRAKRRHSERRVHKTKGRQANLRGPRQGRRGSRVRGVDHLDAIAAVNRSVQACLKAPTE